ncbi:MAG: helix-turn-helix transcriptional regulator [Bacteroidota bacterium]
MSKTLKAAPWIAGDLAALQHDPEFLAEDLVLAVCEQIAAAMSEDGVSQKELATRLGKTPSAVSQLLSGDQNVSLRRLVEVACALGRGVEPPRLVPFVATEVEAVDEGHYSHSLQFSVDTDRCVTPYEDLWAHVAAPTQERYLRWSADTNAASASAADPAEALPFA